jgi:hypothetical protein
MAQMKFKMTCRATLYDGVPKRVRHDFLKNKKSEIEHPKRRSPLEHLKKTNTSEKSEITSKSILHLTFSHLKHQPKIGEIGLGAVQVLFGF